MRAVVYTRVSTDEQNPKSQLEEVLRYCEERGYEVVKVFEEEVSGSVAPLERPVFREMLEFCKRESIKIIVMYDLTRFYRATSPLEALNLLRRIMEEQGVLIDFAREPAIEDPLMRELWLFIKSWFSSYERLQIAQRTRYGLLRAKREGRIYHRPDLVAYYAAWLFNKEVGEVTKEEYEAARKQLIAIVRRYWEDPSIKKTKLGELLARGELRGMYERFPKAPKSYLAFYRLMKRD